MLTTGQFLLTPARVAEAEYSHGGSERKEPMMQGVSPAVLAANPLNYEDPEFAERPMDAFNAAEILGEDRMVALREFYGDVDLDAILRRLPAKALQQCFTFDQLCKIKFSQSIMMESCVEELFDRGSDAHVVYRKVDNSMWRWGYGRAKWNDVVDAYNAIKDFSLCVDEFDVTLDFTTGYNERGYSRDARVFLDGVFGLLVHYRGRHVMTIGFSLMSERRVLIQQIQMVNRRKNRFLYKLPENYVEHVVDCFAKAFKDHTICMADGESYTERNLRDYCDQVMTMNDHVVRETGDTKTRAIEARAELNNKRLHLAQDAKRITELYSRLGKWERGEEIKVNGLLHHTLKKV